MNWKFGSRPFWGTGLWSRGFSLLFVSAALLTCSNTSAQAPLKKNVLILNEVGLSHPLTSTVTRQIFAGIQDKPGRYVEFYSESLDLMSFPDKPSRAEVKDWLVKKYGDYKLDAVVAVGPDAVNFLAKNAQTMFLEVPIVICGSVANQAGNPILDSRFTGTCMRREPEKTIEVALNLLPDTRRMVVVAGNSAFDKLMMSKVSVSTPSPRN